MKIIIDTEASFKNISSRDTYPAALILKLTITTGYLDTPETTWQQDKQVGESCSMPVLLVVWLIDFYFQIQTLTVSLVHYGIKLIQETLKY